jgi:hypothetical protein
MAIFGSARDISMIRKVNRELLHDVITQQCAIYKYALDKTKVNMYGEASGGKWFNGPLLLNALITVGNNTSPTSDLGVDFNWDIKVAFLLDDLVDANIVPETGDVILYQESYFEINNTIHTQYFAGKDPDYPYEANPLNPGLANFGYNVSLVCETHYIPADRVNIIKQRL